ncbi:nuclease-related domain-containing protein [Halalkalicoccus sp. NIPERK01]|uniref:nuclease-related domain-containing protein n=1 Tax=Halalkalicoccus sp. NIPERK01 TaxID=3053469 RepID=UPI00256EE04F|nr:nuclease-related domain-containing protein [Halalkalicoccus sp. NIPERK01]MDL5362375.1 nuclease-related domain-containing protein [Halalkalicoccus sp. NIPERK01]
MTLCELCSAKGAESVSDHVALCNECLGTRRGEEIKFQQSLFQTLEKVDTKKTITQLKIHLVIHNYITNNPNINADSAGVPPGLLRHGINLLCSFENSSGKIAYQEVVDELFNVFSNYQDKDMNSLRADGMSDQKKIESDIELALRDRDLISGRFASGQQEKRVAKVSYREFDKELTEQNGFTIDEAIQFVISINQLFHKKENKIVNLFIRLANPADYPTHDELRFFKDDILRSAITPIVENISERYFDSLWIYDSKMYNEIKIPNHGKFSRFLNRMSTTFGNQEGIGITPEMENFNRPYRCPYDIGPLEKHLFVKTGNKYLWPDRQSTFLTLSSTFYYDIRKSNIDSGEFSDRWGKYVEELTFEYIRNLFNDKNIYQNVKYDNPDHPDNNDKAEADIVIKHNDRLLVIECKSRKLTAGTRSGYDSLEKIRSEVEDGIDGGYRQATRFIEGVKSGYINKISVDGKKIKIGDNYEDYIPIIIMGNHYGRITTRFLLELIKERNFSPYATDVYSLEAISKDASADEFLEYINVRRRLVNTQVEVWNDDELDCYWSYKKGILNHKLISILERAQFERPNELYLGKVDDVFTRTTLHPHFDLPSDILQAEISIGVNESRKIGWICFPLEGAQIRHHIFGIDPDLEYN